MVKPRILYNEIEEYVEKWRKHIYVPAIVNSKIACVPIDILPPEEIKLHCKRWYERQKFPGKVSGKNRGPSSPEVL